MNEEQPSPTTIHEDNQGCIALLTCSRDQQRTKHIDVRYHYTRELVHNGTIAVVHCPTARMVADLLTKPLGRLAFETLKPVATNSPAVHKLENNATTDKDTTSRPTRTLAPLPAVSERGLLTERACWAVDDDSDSADAGPVTSLTH